MGRHSRSRGLSELPPLTACDAGGLGESDDREKVEAPDLCNFRCRNAEALRHHSPSSPFLSCFAPGLGDQIIQASRQIQQAALRKGLVRAKPGHHGLIDEAPQFPRPLIMLHFPEFVSEQKLIPLLDKTGEVGFDQYVQPVVHRGVATWNYAETAGDQLEAPGKY